ncbi:type IV pilin protein [Candidatus Pelagibacter sp. Uisw_090]|uniref:type IV pilin protein n=1 Tax=Candidatus Pelagibacter sp. Uisw_090 TaxID=3230993 RepID=UPI0039ED2ED3
MSVKLKAFTLIELLVVVAIIGILAAVGVVAYNGYTSSAKQKVVQQNIKSIYKLWSVENARCLAMDSSEPVLKSYTDGTSIGTARCEYMNRGHDGSVNIIQNIFLQGVNFKNPYGTHNDNGSTNCSDKGGPNGDGNLGHNFICYNSSTMTLRIAACFKTPCATSSNRVEKFIKFDTW